MQSTVQLSGEHAIVSEEHEWSPTHSIVQADRAQSIPALQVMSSSQVITHDSPTGQ